MNDSIFDRWAALPGKAEVALLSAPFTFPPSPSIALSIFKSCLSGAGISSEVLYPIFPLIRTLGMEHVKELHSFAPVKGVNEFLFANLTDVRVPYDERDFVEEIFCDRDERWRTYHAELFREYRRKAEACVEAAARRVLNLGARVVAASSIFSQQNASLAVLRRVKELDPGIATVIGGFNVSGDMGVAVLRDYPSVDYVFFGEGDEVFAEVMRKAIAGDRDMPYGVWSREDLGGEIPFRLTRDMDTVPTPDYSDYFAEIDRERAGFYGECLLFTEKSIADPDKYYPPGFDAIVFLEGSRGCAWGQKRPCSFCSANGIKNVYREKTPALLYEEIRRTMERRPGTTIQLSDNMLGPNMRRELLPMLKADGHPRSMFAEVLSTLGEKDLRALGEAGFYRVQPGTESLNDHLLRLMGKGSTGVHNVAFLKYARTWGVTPLWNMLFGVPGECAEDYEELLGLLPLLVHLQPPMGANPIAFVRFSRYLGDPAAYGLELEPQPSSRYWLGDDPERIRDMAVYFRLKGGPFKELNERNTPLHERLKQAVEEWRELWEAKRGDLQMTQTPERISILDTRPCTIQIFTRLEGVHRDLYDLAWKPLAPEGARRALTGRYAPEEIDTAAEELIRHRLMIKLSGLYLALAVPFRKAGAPKGMSRRRCDTSVAVRASS